MHTRLTTAFAVCLLAAACSHGGSGEAPAPTCKSVADCGPSQFCFESRCVPACKANGDCSNGQVCEDSICMAPGCGSDAQCGVGQKCIDGACAAPIAASAVASCEVAPERAVVNAGATVQLRAIAKDASGRALAFAAFDWSASGGAISVEKTTGLVTGRGNGAPENLTVTAAVRGSGTTCTGVVRSYGPFSAVDRFRVVVIDRYTKQPIAGAGVSFGGSVNLTDGDGVVFWTGDTGFQDIHVYAKGYSYVTFRGVPKNAGGDFLVPLETWTPPTQKSGFTGHMADAEFAPLAVQGERVHLALFGSGLPGSLLDFSTDTLLGPAHNITVDLAGTPTAVTLPSGVVLGVGSNYFDTQDYRVYPAAGQRALWGIGGNLAFSEVLRVLGPALQGSTSDPGTILSQLLPLLGKTQAGAVLGVRSPPDAPEGQPPLLAPTSIPLNARLRLRAVANVVPDLPQVGGTYVGGVLALAGAFHDSLGFVPLGLTAARGQGAKVVDPTCTGTAAQCATGKLPIRFAAPNNGMEGSPVALSVLAVNSAALSPGSSAQVALSGQVKLVDVGYTAPPEEGQEVAFTDGFLRLPGSGDFAVHRFTRNADLKADADTRTQLYRLDIEATDGLRWTVWTGRLAAAPFGTTFTFPIPPAGFPDPFDTAKNARLVGLQLGTPTTALMLETFGSQTLDRIGTSLKAFTVAEVPIQDQ